MTEHLFEKYGKSGCVICGKRKDYDCDCKPQPIVETSSLDMANKLILEYGYELVTAIPVTYSHQAYGENYNKNDSTHTETSTSINYVLKLKGKLK